MKIIATAIAIVSLSAIANAHSGRTDSQGGHHDRSTGTYHKHIIDVDQLTVSHSGRTDKNGGHHDRKTGGYHKH